MGATRSTSLPRAKNGATGLRDGGSDVGDIDGWEAQGLRTGSAIQGQPHPLVFSGQCCVQGKPVARGEHLSVAERPRAGHRPWVAVRRLLSPEALPGEVTWPTTDRAGASMYVPVVSFPREAWAPHPRWTQWLAGQLGACRARYRPTTSFPERAPPPPNRGGPFISRGAASARSTATVFLANLWLDGSLGTTDASGGSGPNGGNGPPTPSHASRRRPGGRAGAAFWGA
eukprot:ctg_347.g169